MICGLLQSLEQPSLQVTEAWTEKELQSEGAAQQVLGVAWGLLCRLAGRDGHRAAGGLVSPCKGPVGGLKSSL